MLSAALALCALPAAGPVVHSNDNLRPAGHVEAGRLTLHLVASTGVWHPEGANGEGREVAAFAEVGGELSTPGPLIRAKAGTAVTATIRNTLAYDLAVHGLCRRPGPCAAAIVAAGATSTFRFVVGHAGTYHYWAARAGDGLDTRPAVDSQLGGAIVVDSPRDVQRDRIFVVTVFADPDKFKSGADLHLVPTINGASWPLTERLRYQVGERVRFRVVNLSFESHAMHLHGFHFSVEAEGDGIGDRAIPPSQRQLGVTEHIGIGRTFLMAWTPTRPGNWLFHCHMNVHMLPDALRPADHAADGEMAGMAGLVLGITVTGAAPREVATTTPPDRATMTVSLDERRYGSHPGYRVEFPGRDAPRLDPGAVPGPVLVVERGRPTEITVENHLSEPTAIHWHGIELESYYDGVPGFGGVAGSVTPPIAPGESFVAKFTAPRAGTFIYHTHWHDAAQLAGGLYGPLIVVDPGSRFDPETDHIAILGLSGVDPVIRGEPFALNGRATPAPIRMRAGVANRLRLINITSNNVNLVMRLIENGELSVWKPLARDGAELPAALRVSCPARYVVTVGQTYDVEIAPSGPRLLFLEVRRPNGRWVAQLPLDIR